MEIKDFRLQDIVPYENNPRFNEQAVDAVADSIKEFGFLNPVVLDKDRVIICGHTRYLAAQKLGLETVPVIIADCLTPEQVRAYRIIDNKTSELATWNYQALVVEIQDLNESGYGTKHLGFADEVLSELLYHEEEDIIIDGETDPDYLPEMTGGTVSRTGEMYALGEHRLLCADKIDGAKLPEFMFDGSARLYLARIQEWSEDAGLALKNAGTVLAPGGCFYLFHQDRDTLNVRLACSGCGLEVHETLLWLKSRFGMNDYQYQVQNESVLYGWREGGSHHWYSDRKQSNVMEYNNAPSGYDPVAMSIYLVRNSSARGDIVFDNFSETGNSVIACEQTSRRCRCVACDPDIADLIRCRWAEFVNGPGCDWRKLTPKINRKAK